MDHPNIASELGHAVAKGLTTATMADCIILARYADTATAKAHAIDMRRSADVWRHIRGQILQRITDIVTAEHGNTPRNAILAAAHDCNRAGALREHEVTNAVDAAIAAAEAAEKRRIAWKARDDANARRPARPGARRDPLAQRKAARGPRGE